MLHEFKEIINTAFINQQKGIKNVLVTVVDLEGSSYRKPGVRMLISENNTFTGAVSGGCVEKEIVRRAQTVFKDNKAKIITYDGRYRLGCEGILYILIEPFEISTDFVNEFTAALAKREEVNITCFYKKEDEAFGAFGTIISFKNKLEFTFTTHKIQSKKNSLIFKQTLQPLFKLLIIGGEHDAVKLCKIASNLGWQIEIITAAKDSKDITNFPGASSLVNSTPEIIQLSKIDNNTAIVIMNHSYVQDLKYLIKLVNETPIYIGILGAPKRREKLFNELFEYAPETTTAFLNCIYTPAGLQIGAKTAEEIAVSIVAEILAVVRKKEPHSLRELNGKIHS